MKRADMAESTRGNYEGLLQLHLRPTFGKVKLRRLEGAWSRRVVHANYVTARPSCMA